MEGKNRKRNNGQIFKGPEYHFRIIIHTMVVHGEIVKIFWVEESDGQNFASPICAKYRRKVNTRVLECRRKVVINQNQNCGSADRSR